MFRNSWNRRSFPASSALAGQQLVITSADVQDRKSSQPHGMFPHALKRNLGVGQEKKATRGPQVLVFGSIYHGSILCTYF